MLIHLSSRCFTVKTHGIHADPLYEVTGLLSANLLLVFPLYLHLRSDHGLSIRIPVMYSQWLLGQKQSPCEVSNDSTSRQHPYRESALDISVLLTSQCLQVTTHPPEDDLASVAADRVTGAGFDFLPSCVTPISSSSSSSEQQRFRRKRWVEMGYLHLGTLPLIASS